MSDDAWLTRGPVRTLVEALVDDAVRRYRIERPEAEAIFEEVLAASEALREAAAGEPSAERIRRSGAYKRAAAAARRRVYYHLRRYQSGGTADLESLVARLADCGTEAPADERRRLARAVAEAHKSTAERLPWLAEFHRELFAWIGGAGTIVDVGCGMYPLVFPFDGEGSSVSRYVAADSSPVAVAAVEAYARTRGDGRLAALRWDLRDGWDEVLRHGGGGPFDAALLLKLVPVVARQARRLLPVLAATPARTWVLSGSRTSLARRASIERREKAVLRRFVEGSARRVEAEFAVGEEFVWIVR